MPATPFSYRQYAGNGSNKNFAVPFSYLLKAHVKVYIGFNLLDGTYASELVDGTGFSWSSATQIQTTTAPTSLQTLTVIRKTPDSSQLVPWQDGSTLIASDLNTADLQNLYVVQEQQDRNDAGITQSTAAATAATAATTAANTATSTANTALSTANTALSNANTAVTTANTATTNASAAVTTANTASANASAAVTTANTASSTANTASTNASGAVTTANAAAATAATALSTANTAATNASTALSTANTASSNASAAVTTANTASTNASNAVTTANTASSNATTAVNTANTASTNASNAVTTANTANTKADQAIAAVSNSINYTLIANVAAIPASPANNTYIEVADSTGLESFSPLTGRPAGFVGDSGLTSRLKYTTTGSTWQWLNYYANDSDARFLKKAGGTVSGNLAVTGTLTKGGSNVVTVGDTGTVTSTMLADGTIVNADISATAAIAGTKVSPDFGSQAVVTTGTSTAASFIPTSSTVPTTGIYNASGSLAISTSSVGRVFVDASGNVGVGLTSPASRFHIYDSVAVLTVEGASTSSASLQFKTNSNNRFKISTPDSSADLAFYSSGSTERLRITSAGLVGVGTSVPAKLLEVNEGDIQIRNSSTASFNTLLNYGLTFRGTNQVGQDRGTIAEIKPYLGGQSDNDFGLQFRTQATTAGGVTTKMTLTPGGSLGIGSSTPQASADIRGTASASAEIVRVGNGTKYIGIGTEGTNYSWIQSFASTSLCLNPLGNNVGIGTNPATPLHVNSGAISTGARLESSSAGAYLNFANSSGNGVYIGANTSAFYVETNGSERFRCDSSGRLLLGTSNANGDYTLQIQGDASSANAAGCIYLRRGLNTAAIGANVGADLGKIQFGANDGTVAARIQCLSDATWGSTSDTPGALTFSVTSDGASSPTERMRITNQGVFRFTNNGTYTNSSYNEFYTNANTIGLYVRAANASYASDVFYLESDRATTNGTYSFIKAGPYGSAARFNVADSGNVTNTNNSYGAISDIRLKENIVDAGSQWSDLKALKVRKYNFKEGQTHTQIGLVAQEVELVSPGLVSESLDRDKEGNDLGTVTKSVNYSVLYMKAVKALQEAMERIEQLETKVAALESA